MMLDVSAGLKHTRNLEEVGSNATEGTNLLLRPEQAEKKKPLFFSSRLTS